MEKLYIYNFHNNQERAKNNRYQLLFYQYQLYRITILWGLFGDITDSSSFSNRLLRNENYQ